MDKLPAERKADIKKMSDVRLITRLKQAGLTTEQLETMDREAMLNTWAECIVTGKDKVPAAASASANPISNDPEIERMRLTLDIERFKWEQDEKIKEMEMRKRELQIREEEQQLRRQEIARNREKDAKEIESRNSAVSKIKLFGDAF
jgi:hypothetical protein